MGTEFQTYVDETDGMLYHKNNDCGGVVVGERYRLYCLKCLPHRLFDTADPALWLYVLTDEARLAQVLAWLRQEQEGSGNAH